MKRLIFGLLAVAVSGSTAEPAAAQEPEFDINRARVGARSRFEPFSAVNDGAKGEIVPAPRMNGKAGAAPENREEATGQDDE